MYYVIEKISNKILSSGDTFLTSYEFVKNYPDGENVLKILEDVEMEAVSRIVYVDGKCVYKSPKFWSQNFTNFKNNYQSHKVVDILGQDMSLDRFKIEDDQNKKDIFTIDGRPGQIKYDMKVGEEFVSLFREECILTKFTKESNTSPMIIFSKLATVISMLSAGAFREARQWLQSHRNTIKDDFLTDERIDKYIDMLNSADAIEYATEDDYFYVVPERTEANEFLEE